MYSAGVMLLQAAMPALRSDSALIAFRRKLEQCNYDLRAWRAQQVDPPTSTVRSHVKFYQSCACSGWNLSPLLLLHIYPPQRL